MGRLTIQEVIEHCEKTVKNIERNLEMYRNWLELEPMTTNVKRYLEHKQTAEWLKELQHYKDLEEQGLLHKAQLKNGTPIYVLQWDYWNGDYDVHEECYLYGMTEFLIGEINKDWWLTKEKAEAKLKELKEGAE